MHIPGSRTIRRYFRRGLGWPLRDFVREHRPGRFLRGDSKASPIAASGEDQRVFAEEFTKYCREYSEWGGYFFSDNIVSNELDYLRPLSEIGSLRGTAYLGLGPEQNFSCISSAQPDLSFIVDIRRDNYRLHLLYKAIFEEAENPIQWLSVLLGRPSCLRSEQTKDFAIAELIQKMEQNPPNRSVHRENHRRLVDRIARLEVIGHPLDRRRLGKIHDRFFAEQLEITFQLRKRSNKSYPSLRQLIGARGEREQDQCFLASGKLYEGVRRAQIENRIIPIVGDFTGHHAILGVAGELRRRRLPIGVIYASNVEQYIFEEGRYERWIANLRELPVAPESRIIRSYVDQGRAHPRQRQGERITTVVQSLQGFLARDKAKKYRSYWEIVSDDSI